LTNELIREILKTDLQISVPQYDDYLDKLIGLAQDAISKEGITLDDSTADGMLVEVYAAYLYRKRREDSPMPGCSGTCLTTGCLARKRGLNDGHCCISD
jgi:hypothetical protein